MAGAVARARRCRTTALGVAAATASLVLVLLPGSGSHAADEVSPEVAPTAARAWQPAGQVPSTSTRVASFNVLGDSHTAPGGKRKGWASGVERMGWATKIIRREDLQIVGLQEFQFPQFKEFVRLMGDSYGLYPGMELGYTPVQNSIAWSTAHWERVQASGSCQVK